MFFIELIQSDPGLYFALLIGITLSIVLHELGHGYVAIKLGDDTPIRLNRMTFNPLVNLGPVSLILLAIFGIGWGSMPVDPTRLRGRYGDLWVALAGPAVNLAISLFCILLLIAIAVGESHNPDASFPFEKAFAFCRWMAILNMLLTIFNLIPVYPLDGCNALMSLDSRFRQFVQNNVAFQQFGFIGLIILINVLGSSGFGLFGISAMIVQLIAGIGLRLASVLV